MKKNFPVFFVVVATFACAAGIALSAFIFSPAHAYAYATGPMTPGTSVQGYNFGPAFQNLVSPFVNFFQNIKLTTTGNATIPINIGGTTTGSPNMTLTINGQQYITRFENWFYGATGTNINGLVAFIFQFFAWLFSFGNQAVGWLVTVLKGFVGIFTNK